MLFRGINVGGKNILPMKALVSLLEENDLYNVKTYIQSGNVVLQSKKKPAVEIGKLIEDKFGFKPEVLIIDKSAFELSITDNPFSAAEGKLVHFYFCSEEPKLNSERLSALVAESEKYELHGNVFYLYAPNGIGRSKLVANIESCLGVTATGRNMNTVNKLKQLVESY